MNAGEAIAHLQAALPGLAGDAAEAVRVLLAHERQQGMELRRTRSQLQKCQADRARIHLRLRTGGAGE